MKISVNGKTRDVSARNVALVLDELDLAGAGVATAVNGEFVPVASRGARPLVEGDRLEILTPMQGG